MKWALVLLMVAGLVVAQEFMPNRRKAFQPAVESVTPYPQTLNPTWYWTVQDLPIGMVSQWVDRINGSTYGSSVAGKQPTNQANGLSFDGSNDVLTNPAINRIEGVVNGGWSVWFCFKRRSLAATFGVTIAKGDFDPAFMMRSDKLSFEFSSPHDLTDFIPTNEIWTVAYTNGITVGGSFTNGIYFGSVGPRGGTMSITVIGGDSGLCWDGWQQEIAIWTNHILSPSEITGLNSYADRYRP